jgi:hypothetical protein
MTRWNSTAAMLLHSHNTKSAWDEQRLTPRPLPTGSFCSSKQGCRLKLRFCPTTRLPGSCLRHSTELAPEPDHTSNDLKTVWIAILPARVSLVVAPNGNPLAGRSECQPLDQQCIINPQHINTIAQALTAIAPVDEDLVSIG